MKLPKITLLPIEEDKEETALYFFINWKTLELEDIRICINEDGFGIEHELAEIALLITTLQTEPEVAKYDWLTCRIIFHRITKNGDIPEHISPHG